MFGEAKLDAESLRPFPEFDSIELEACLEFRHETPKVTRCKRVTP